MLVALVLGLINVLVRPVLVLLTLPITLLTFGLFLLVINGAMFFFWRISWWTVSMLEGCGRPFWEP